MMRAAIPILVGLLLCVPLAARYARANGADDGNRGLQALDQGNSDEAIKLFTHAIKYGKLDPDDEQFAYANRGRAYMKKGDTASAIADLDVARQMKPDDTDAQNDLLAALQVEIPPDSIPGRPKASALSGILEGLGQALLQGVADGIAQGSQPQQQQ